MPPKPSWFIHLPEIINTLSDLAIPVVDRAICEKIFAVKRRRAITLMQHLGGYRSGNSVLLDRHDLIAKLRQLENSPEFHWERRRKEALAASLTELDRSHLAKTIRLPVAPTVLQQQAQTLPACVSLEKGKLTVNFHRTEELFASLFALAQAGVNDFEGIRQLAESGLAE